MAFSPDGARIATAGSDGVIGVWDALSGRLRYALRGHAAAVGDVAFLPEGRLISSSDDGDVRVWSPDRELARVVIAASREGL